MTTPEWETIAVPRGAYVSWSDRPGQHITGKVVDFSPDGGTDFAGAVCPCMAIELTEPAYSVNKHGERSDFAVGETVQLNVGQVSLKRAVRAADPNVGDLVKIELTKIVKTGRGSVKEFNIAIARGAGTSAAVADDDCPF